MGDWILVLAQDAQAQVAHSTHPPASPFLAALLPDRIVNTDWALPHDYQSPTAADQLSLFQTPTHVMRHWDKRMCLLCTKATLTPALMVAMLLLGGMSSDSLSVM